MSSSPQIYLDRMGIKYKRSGDSDQAVFTCPECKATESNSINLKSGMWNCFKGKCGASGTYYDLKVKHGNAYDIPKVKQEDKPDPLAIDLMAVYNTKTKPKDPVWQWNHDLKFKRKASEARKYLKSRGLHEDIWDMCLLGWMPGKKSGVSRSVGGESNGWITIPYGGNNDMVKLRAVPPEQLHNGKPIRYRRIKGGQTSHYNPLHNKIDTSKPTLVIGGEIDSITILALLFDSDKITPNFFVSEYNILAPTSESSYGILVDIVDTLENDVILLFDNDQAGRLSAEKAATAFGRWRCKIGAWPDGYKDANQAFVAGKLDMATLSKIIETAKPTAGGNIGSTTEYETRVFHRIRETSQGMDTGIPHLNFLLGGGLRRTETSVWTGHTGTGKTVMCQQIVNHFSKRGLRSWVCPFEMGVPGQIERTLWQWCGQDPNTMTDIHIRKTLQQIGDSILWFDHYGSIDEGAFLETMKYVLRRLGVDLMLLDHRDFMVKGGADKWVRCDMLVKNIIKAVQQSMAHCIIVAHPGKPPKRMHTGTSPDDWIPQLTDAKGFSDLYQDVDNFVSMYRPRTSDRSNEVGPDGLYGAGAVVLKQRSPRGTEGNVVMRYDKEKMFFKDVTHQQMV